MLLWGKLYQKKCNRQFEEFREKGYKITMNNDGKPRQTQFSSAEFAKIFHRKLRGLNHFHCTSASTLKPLDSH